MEKPVEETCATLEHRLKELTEEYELNVKKTVDRGGKAGAQNSNSNEYFTG